MRLNLLTSWNVRCGIAEYSRRLVDALRPLVEVEVVPATFLRSPRNVYRAMGMALGRGDVAHVQHSYAFFGGMHPLRCGWPALAGAVTKPMVLTIHELDARATGAYHLSPPLERAYKRRFNRRVFLHPAVRAWMVHAGPLREALLELGAPAARVIYRPLPIEAPTPWKGDADALRASLGLVGKRPLVIPGFLARRKGYDLALAALRSLPPEFVLVAAGGAHEADRSASADWLRREAALAGVPDRLIITGYLPEDELEGVVAIAELILAPFREMSASASLGYALARGKAVVASDLPQNRALGCIRLFPAGDAPALASAIRELSTAPALRAELARSALLYAGDHSYKSLAAETAALYQELAPRNDQRCRNDQR